MIDRYTTPEMAELWSDQARYATWVRVEVLATEAQARIGRVPDDALADIRQAPVPSVERVAALEYERDHEVLSFLAAFCENIPEKSARWVHWGMTSYDLVDTALGYTLTQATDLVTEGAVRLRTALTERALEHWDTHCVGRTHGVHAEPTTFGHKLAAFAFAIHRSVERLRSARETVAVGTISGSVGTYALIDPTVEDYVCGELGLGKELVPTQVVARDRHAQLLQALATLGACVDQLATEFRLLQRTEVDEVEEPRTKAYQGSSAMPHKRNPTTSERLCGLARLLRSYVSVSLENVALWHERDLSHSSVERVSLPDATTVAHYLVGAAADVVEGLDVHVERMREELDRSGGALLSSAVLAHMLENGAEREQSYRSIQRAAYESRHTGEPFGCVLQRAGIDVGDIGPGSYLTHHKVIRRRLEDIRGMED